MGNKSEPERGRIAAGDRPPLADKPAGDASHTPAPHLGWHSRGYLPHLDVAGLVQSVTFRLADSLPTEVIEKWSEMAQLSSEIERRQRLEEWLDRGSGSCALRDPAIAGLVQSALLFLTDSAAACSRGW